MVCENEQTMQENLDEKEGIFSLMGNKNYLNYSTRGRFVTVSLDGDLANVLVYGPNQLNEQYLLDRKGLVTAKQKIIIDWKPIVDVTDFSENAQALEGGLSLNRLFLHEDEKAKFEKLEEGICASLKKDLSSKDSFVYI